MTVEVVPYDEEAGEIVTHFPEVWDMLQQTSVDAMLTSEGNIFQFIERCLLFHMIYQTDKESKATVAVDTEEPECPEVHIPIIPRDSGT
jgi:hypothetical protein